MTKKVQDTKNPKKTAEKSSKADPKATAAKSTRKKTEKSSRTGVSTQKLKDEIKDWQEKYIRLSAEFDNFRKRTLREKADLLKFAGEDLILSLLPVIDDFERALQSLEQTEDINALKEGIHLIYNKFSEFLKQKGITEIECNHAEFDTDVHEAVTKIPAPEPGLKGKVVDVIAKGYEMNGKVIRHSKVVIGD